METIVLQRRIYLEPKYLDKNIMNHLLKKLKRVTLDQCAKEYGYIISVNPAIKIVNNENTFFTLEFEAKTYKPKVKQKVEGVVCGVYEQGIFIDVFEKVKVLIPNIYIKDYTFDAVSCKYENNNNRILMGDKIKVEIKVVGFDEEGFKCIGFLA